LPGPPRPHFATPHCIPLTASFALLLLLLLLLLLASGAVHWCSSPPSDMPSGCMHQQVGPLLPLPRLCAAIGSDPLETLARPWLSPTRFPDLVFRLEDSLDSTSRSKPHSSSYSPPPRWLAPKTHTRQAARAAPPTKTLVDITGRPSLRDNYYHSRGRPNRPLY